MSSSVLLLVRSNRALLRDLLHLAFASDPTIIVAQALQAKHADDLARAGATVVLIDGKTLRASLPDIPQLRAQGSRIVVLLSSTGDYQLSKAQAAGATGFVHFTEGFSALREAITHTARGSLYVSPGVHARRTQPAIMQLLTDRERQVFELAARGTPDADSATALGLAPATVECYRTSLLKKLGIRDWMQLAALGMQVGASCPEDIDVTSGVRRSARRTGG